MKHLLGAFLALSLVPACGGEAEQAPGPSAPPPVPPQDTTATMTDTATETAAAATPPAAPRPPLADLQRNAIRGMIAAFNAHDPSRLAALYKDDAVFGTPGPTGWLEEKGKPSIERTYRMLFSVFPDMKWASQRVYLKDTVVIQEWAATGTHSGDLGGARGTDKPIGLYGATAYWFNEDGLIERDHTFYDAGTVGAQVGAQKGQARAVPTVDVAEPQFIVATGAPDENRWVDATKALYGAFGNRDEKSYLNALAKNVLRVAYAQASDRQGDQAARQDFQSLLKAFPDLQVNPQHVWGFGDRVVAETVTTGTQTGALGPIKATKRPVTLHTLDVHRFDNDGKVTEMTSYGSSVELLGQLGLLSNDKATGKAGTGTGTGGQRGTTPPQKPGNTQGGAPVPNQGGQPGGTPQPSPTGTAQPGPGGTGTP